MKDDLLDESLLEATPPPKLEVSPSAGDDASLDLGLEPEPAAPRVIQGSKLPEGLQPPALDVGLLREVPPELQELGSDALTPLLEEAPVLVLGEDALQELPPEPSAVPVVPVVRGDEGFSYDSCPKCGAPKGTGALCDTCGTRLVFKAKKKEQVGSGKKRCRDCGTANKATRSRCVNCGCRLPSDD